MPEITDPNLIAEYRAAQPQTRPPAPRVGYIPGVPKAGRDVELQRDRVALTRDQQQLRLDQEKAERDRQEANRKAVDFQNNQNELEASGGVKGTEAQNKAAALTTTLQAAMNNIKRVSERSPDAQGPGLGEIVAGAFGKDAKELAQSSDRRDIAGSQFLAVDSALTLATGAAYTPSQLEGYTRSLFPTIADTPENIASKRRKFEEIIQAGRAQAGAKAPSVDQALAAVDAIYGAAPQAETPEKTGFTTENLYQFTPAENEAYNAFLRSSPTPDEVIDFVSRLSGGKQVVKPEDALAAIEGVKKGARAELNPVPSETNGVKDSILGAVAGAADTFTGGYLPEIAGGLAGAVTGDPTLTQKAEENLAAIRNQAPGSFFAGQVAGGIGGSAALGAGAAKLGSKIAPSAAQFLSGGGKVAAGGELVKDVAYGGLYGSGSAKEGERGAGALTGALGAAAGNVAGSALVGGLGRVLSPKTNEFVKRLRDAGVKTTPLQSIGPKSGEFEGKVSRIVPGLGDVMQSARDESLRTFNTAFLNEGLKKINAEIPMNVSGTAAMARAKQSFDDAYDSALSNMSLKPDAQYIADVDELVKRARDGLLGDDANVKQLNKIFESQVGRKLKRGPLDGKDFKRTSSELGKEIEKATSAQKTDLADGLLRIKTIVDNAARRSSPAEAVAKLDSTDEGYALFVRAQEAAKSRGGETGMFTPLQLDAAIQRGDKSVRSNAYLRGEALGQDFAEAGKQILGSNAEGSPTAGRAALGAVMAGGLGYVSPPALGAGLAASAAYAPKVRDGISSVVAGNRGKTANKAAKLLRDNKRVGTAIGAGIATPALIGPQ